jgi:hypothetical protein
VLPLPTPQTAPPPDPPGPPLLVPPGTLLPDAPKPPPADVIVLKTEFEPFELAVLSGADPPAPTVIGKAVAVTVTLFGELG